MQPKPLIDGLLLTVQPGYYLARPVDLESRLSSLLVSQHIFIGSL